MPQIEVRSTSSGYSYNLCSSNPEIIGPWLAEIFTLIKPNQTAPAQVRFWPMLLPDGQPDFTPDGSAVHDVHLIQSAGWHGTAELADKLMKMVMREVEAGGVPSLPEKV